jgi:hypothetical protein
MKNYDHIIDRLARSAADGKVPEVDLPPGLATRVLAQVRGGVTVEPGYFAVLERWLVGAAPAAVVLAGTLWLASGPTATPRGFAEADAGLADALFEEALQP